MTPEEQARKYAHAIPPVDLGSSEGIAVIAQAIRDAEQRGGAEVTKEWQIVIATLARAVVDNLETVTAIDLKPGRGHPYYRGQMALLQTLRRMADNDAARFGLETSEEVTPATGLIFGARVNVSAVYKRRQRYSDDRSGTWLKWWDAQRLTEPRPALYIGYRTLYDGRSDYLGPEEGTAFYPDRHYRAALVVFNERSRPVLAPMDGIKPA